MSKRNQKKITQKSGAINSVEIAIERLNATNALEYAKKQNRPIKYLRKDTHTGETIVEIIQPNKIKSKTIYVD